MKPSLPPRVSTAIDRISAATWNRLIDCLAYAMSHPRGDGHTIFNRLGDVLTTNCRASGNSAAALVGLFSVTDNGDGTLTVGGGYVNRNGLQFFWWPGDVTIKAAPGALCICTEPVDKLGNWSEVTPKIMPEPNQCAFPVAEITVVNGKFVIEQYPVTVAQIFYSGRCPIAEL